MAEINANFVVQPFGITITPDAPGISVTATPTNLNVYSLGYAQPSGNVGELQFNLNGQILGGAANTLASNGNVRFTNISNLKINGGANAYFLQTDGTGNLTWAQGTANVSGNGTAAGANTQIQISDGTGNFTSGAGFTFDNATNLFSTPGNVFIAGNANVTGNVSANYFIGNGSQLTGIDSSLIQNGTSNVRTFLNSNVTISAAGNANVVVVQGNGITINGEQNFNGNAAWGAQNLQANRVNANILIGNLQTSNQANITQVGNLINLDVQGLIITNGNIQTSNGYFIGDGGFLANVNGGAFIANGNSNVRIATSNSNVTVSVAGNANVMTVTGTGIVVSGTANISGNTLVGNLYANSGTVKGFALEGNTGNITGNLVSGNANLGNAARANYFIGNLFGTANLANDVVNPAQPNITSVGNLTNLVIATNGNITLSGIQSFISGANSIFANIMNANILVGNYVDSANITTQNVGYFGTQIVLSNANLKFRTAATDRVDISNTQITLSLPLSSNSNITTSTDIIANNITANSNIQANGNVSANYFIGNGSQLTGLPDSSLISNGSANVRTFANANVTISAGGVANTVVAESNLITFWTDLNFNGNGAFGAKNLQLNYLNANYIIGTLVAASANQPNITSLGTLTGLNVNGNVSANFYLGDGGFLSNIPGAANGTSLISIPVANGNVNIIAGGANSLVVTNTGVNVAGTINASGNANFTNIGASGLITATGNVTGGNLVTAGRLSVTGNANVGNLGVGFITATGNINANNFVGANANLTGTANITGNANVGNLGTNRVIATGNISGTQLISNIATGTAPLVVTSTTQVANLNVATAGTANSANTVNVTSEQTSANIFYIAFTNTAGNSRTLYVDDSSNVNGLYYYPDQGDLRGGFLTFRTFRFGGQVVECNPNNENKITFWANSVANIMVIESTLVSTSRPLKLPTYTVANLPNATTLGQGSKAFVSDANATTFHAVVGGSGSNYVPVFSDGTDWRIG
jgi:hypothetical protein